MRRLLTGFMLLALTAVPSAQLGSRPTADWIKMMEAPDRVASLKIDSMIASLGLHAGDTVADIGSGPGVISLPLAKAVGPQGKVYAVEIDRPFLDRVKARAAEAHLRNVVPVLGAFTDPQLPARDVDVAFFHDVLHHIEDRAGYVKAMARYMKPASRMAVIEYLPTGPHRSDPSLILTPEQVGKWMADAGFAPAGKYDNLPGKWYVIYERKPGA